MHNYRSLWMHSFSTKDINLLIKSLASRIDWLKAERARYHSMIGDPMFASFQTVHISFENKIDDEIVELESLQSRLFLNPADDSCSYERAPSSQGEQFLT